MSAPRIERVDAVAYRVPTDAPEADGTLEWSSTTLVVVQVEAAGVRGLGLGYAHAAAAVLIQEKLAPELLGRPALDPGRSWLAMRRAVRNLGRPGLASMAMAAVDVALWDWKARRLGLPLVGLLGAVRDEVDAYASGGFTSQSVDELQKSLAEWVASGFRRVKMKVGSEPEADVERVRAAREAIGDEVELFVDANGAYDRKQALEKAFVFADLGVRWFEEPVSSDDVAGLRLLRDRAPAPLEITAGEYGFDAFDFRRWLEAGAVDVLQADATRCGGVSGFLRAGALCEAFSLPLSAHTAPSLHASLCCALPAVRHVEYFHDHARIERWLFEGAPEPRHGRLRPDPDRSGLGLRLRADEAAPFRVSGGIPAT